MTGPLHPEHPDVPLNVLEPHKLALLQEAVAELRATEAFPLIGAAWSKLAIVLDACERSVDEEAFV